MVRFIVTVTRKQAVQPPHQEVQQRELDQQSEEAEAAHATAAEEAVAKQ